MNFVHLIEEQTRVIRQEPTFKLAHENNLQGNPFNLPQMAAVTSTIKDDLTELRYTRSAPDPQMNLDFLTDPKSTVELVGVVNRMDRQFLRGRSASICGEISVIYRFTYSIREGSQKSRLPATLNLVFPAAEKPEDCQPMAKRWLTLLNRSVAPASAAKEAVFEMIRNPAQSPFAWLDGPNISRLELNIQAYRKPADSDPSDFGTEAIYLLRVFTWNAATKEFEIASLPNQIDRNSLTCTAADSDALCEFKRENRTKLVAFLQEPESVAALDLGIISIDPALGLLSKRAISVSPGGMHRSENQSYWNALGAPEHAIIHDDEIAEAIKAAEVAGVTLRFIQSTDDFRARLNESTCSGCHQTRAIAGFHFPGADREGTHASNSVLLPASPHFFGDIPRRIDLIRKIAYGETLTDEDLLNGYSARPLARYKDALSRTQLIGGWGGTCVIEASQSESARKWSCQSGLVCEQVFRSDGIPGIGTCVPPKDQRKIGDPLQHGTVSTDIFSRDLYKRTKPEVIPAPQNPILRETRILPKFLPRDPPPGNSYYGGHQEFYIGLSPRMHPACQLKEGETGYLPAPMECHDARRDFLTGGFPAGSLRLSECSNLPEEATCALTASSGFNGCIAAIGERQTMPDADWKNYVYSVNTCFEIFTSYSGERACDFANPCRDDYICAKPMEYDGSTFQERLERLVFFPRERPAGVDVSYFEDITGRRYDPAAYGQKRPDDKWAARDDQRGVCIPPYFVFQFRSDGHPAPPPPSITLRPFYSGPR
ncbi:hypothetical protein [Roseovarius aestuarii]|uniref:hypothetical protein n=1 Tax=Roseovarius aestuarii TaxID=475083 RepID=UPI001CBFC038|nr:hypothetical protein [Roseovarius aestuarii]